MDAGWTVARVGKHMDRWFKRRVGRSADKQTWVGDKLAGHPGEWVDKPVQVGERITVFDGIKNGVIFMFLRRSVWRRIVPRESV